MTEQVVIPSAAVLAAKAPAEVSLAGYVMLGFGLVIIIILVVILIKAQLSKTNKIDLNDMLIEPKTGKTSPGRFWTLIGGAAGTWVFVYLPVSGHFDPTYAIFFVGLAFGLKVAGDITAKPSEPDDEPPKPKPRGR